jgi:hypothetical protein
MKRQLLMMFILVTIALAGMLHGGYMHHQRAGEVLGIYKSISRTDAKSSLRFNG